MNITQMLYLPSIRSTCNLPKCTLIKPAWSYQTFTQTYLPMSLLKSPIKQIEGNKYTEPKKLSNKNMKFYYKIITTYNYNYKKLEL